jgi:AcrR family transcriptional regulator
MEKAPRQMLDRAAWIKAATTMLADSGPEGVRVESLAKRLAVTKGSFYWHFKDRQDLLAAVLQYWKEGRIRDIVKQTQAVPGHELEQIHHVLAVYAANRNRKGIPIELAVRDWARRDAQVAAVVAEVDASRFERARLLFLACGLDDVDAAARSTLVYAYVFGVSLLTPETLGENPDACKRRIADLITHDLN